MEDFVRSFWPVRVLGHSTSSLLSSSGYYSGLLPVKTCSDEWFSLACADECVRPAQGPLSFYSLSGLTLGTAACIWQPFWSDVHDFLLQGSPALDGLPGISYDPLLPPLLSASQAGFACLFIDYSDLIVVLSCLTKSISPQIQFQGYRDKITVTADIISFPRSDILKRCSPYPVHDQVVDLVFVSIGGAPG